MQNLPPRFLPGRFCLFISFRQTAVYFLLNGKTDSFGILAVKLQRQFSAAFRRQNGNQHFQISLGNQIVPVYRSVPMISGSIQNPETDILCRFYLRFGDCKSSDPGFRLFQKFPVAGIISGIIQGALTKNTRKNRGSFMGLGQRFLIISINLLQLRQIHIRYPAVFPHCPGRP